MQLLFLCCYLGAQLVIGASWGKEKTIGLMRRDGEGGQGGRAH